MTPYIPPAEDGDGEPGWPVPSFELIVEAINEGILVCTLEGRLLYVNQRMAEMLGYEADEMLGQMLFSFMDDKWTKRAKDNLKRRARGVAEHFEHEFLTKDGRSVPTLVATRPIAVEAHEWEASLVAVTDITRRKELQAKTMELDRLLVAGTLAAGVGHEINNPLAFLSGHLDLAHGSIDDSLAILRDSKLGQTSAEQIEANRRDAIDALMDVQHSLRAASRGALRIRDIIDDLRLFTRDEQEPPYPLEVTEILETTIRLATHQLPRGTRLVREYESVPQVIGYESGLGQVLMNLLLNAVHAIDAADQDESVLRVVLADRKDWVAIDVEDSGHGIPPEHLDRVFDPFFTTKDPDEGTGLGLSISKRLAEKMGAELHLKSQPGEGTCARLRLQPVR